MLTWQALKLNQLVLGFDRPISRTPPAGGRCADAGTDPGADSAARRARADGGAERRPWTDDRAPVEWVTDRMILDYAARGGTCTSACCRPRPDRRRQTGRKLESSGPWPSASGFILCIVVCALGVGASHARADTPPPPAVIADGVQIGSVVVGGMTSDEATTARRAGLLRARRRSASGIAATRSRRTTSIPRSPVSTRPCRRRSRHRPTRSSRSRRHST